MTRSIPFDPERQGCRIGAAAAYWQSEILEEFSDRERGMLNGTFHVAAMIAIRARVGVTCNLGTRAIARDLRISHNTASKIIRHLMDLGWLHKVKDAQYNKYNEERPYDAPEYVLAVPARLAKKFDEYIVKETSEEASEPVREPVKAKREHATATRKHGVSADTEWLASSDPVDQEVGPVINLVHARWEAEKRREQEKEEREAREYLWKQYGIRRSS